MEENKKSKVEEIASSLGFNSINNPSEIEQEKSPFISSYTYSSVRNYLYVFSLGKNALSWPIDSRLIATENEKIKPLDFLNIKGLKLKLRTVLVFNNKENEIVDYEYDCNNQPLILKSHVYNYSNKSNFVFEEYTFSGDENPDKDLPFFLKLKLAYGHELTSFRIEHDKQDFLNIYEDLQKEDKCKIIRFKVNQLNLNLPEHRMLFVDKFLALDFCPIYWQIFKNLPIALSNYFRNSFQLYEEGLITGVEAYNQCLDALSSNMTTEIN
jgi:hypothetical protein